MTLSDLSLKRPVFATVFILALLVLGITSYISLNIDNMPNIDIPYVMVTVAWPGVAPEQMETEVAKKVEEAVGEVPGVKHITTYSDEGVTEVVVEFTMETSPDGGHPERARQAERHHGGPAAGDPGRR